MDLQQELFARIFTHKTAIVGGALMHEYLDKHKNMGGAMLPDFTLQEQAQAYSQEGVQKALETGTLDSLYTSIWESVKFDIPDNLNLMQIA